MKLLEAPTWATPHGSAILLWTSHSDECEVPTDPQNLEYIKEALRLLIMADALPDNSSVLVSRENGCISLKDVIKKVNL